MNNKKIILNRLKSSYNVLTSDMLYRTMLEVLMEDARPSNIKYTAMDMVYARSLTHTIPSKVEMTFLHVANKNKIFQALYGEKYQSDSIPTGKFYSSLRQYIRGSLFFRCRNIFAGKDNYVYSDFWEPPCEYVGKGRLNKKNESMLYLAVDSWETAIQESRVNTDDTYMIMLYNTVKSIEVAEIGWDFNSEITAFISTQFKKSGDVAYEISERLAKEVYQFYCDGWSYPSALNKKGQNLCLNLDAKNKLDLVGAYLYKRSKKANEDELLAIFDLSNKDKIKLFRDWGAKNSKAVETDKLLKEAIQKNRADMISTYGKADKNLEPKYKAVILNTKYD